MRHFDAIVIGTGQSGPFLAKEMAKKGWKVAVIEKGKFGGSCTNVGCTPTKTLIANAKVAYSIQNSKFYGIHVPRYKIDYKAVKARKDKFVRSGSHGVKKSLLDTCTVFEGHARFVEKNRVQVGKEILEADKIFINVGAEPHIPDIQGLDKISYLTNATLLDVTSVPKHLLILGAGYIGIEFAQMFRRFGSKVTIIHSRDRIMNKEDLDVSEALQKILEKEKIDFHLSVNNFAILPASKKNKIVARAGKKKITGTHLLIATGRVPATADLGLDKAGIRTDQKGYIQVDDQLKTSNPHVWALGDCNGKGAFTHTSYNDYQIVAANLLGNENRKVSDRHPIYALFSDPPLGRVGMNEKEAKEKFPHVLMATIPMAWVGRAKEQGETDGLLKIMVDGKTKQILGASFLGFHCDEVIQLVSVVMQAKLPYTIIQEMVGIHPTVSEWLPSLLENLKPI